MADPYFSAFSRTEPPGTDDNTLINVLGDILRTQNTENRWQHVTDDFWCSLLPVGAVISGQGWKLHISATPASAATVLTRTLPILVAANSPFKFARTTTRVAEQNARSTPRGNSGKFITIYPRNDEEAVALAASLHLATEGLAGPRILSDRPYEPGSLVHYRYGAFGEERRLGTDGLYSWVIFDPDGNPVEDRRGGTYSPPSWARCPFPVPQQPNGEKAAPKSVLLDNRYLVREAIRHSNKGGVYRAVDQRDGGDVVIKEARPHVEADDTGRDIRDLLRGEARVLEEIAPLGVAPRLHSLFEQGGHLFVAEDLVPGVSLQGYILDRIRESGWQRSVPVAVRLASRLVELMDGVHRRGVVLRDFNPSNIMVQPDDELRLIDLELATVAADEDGQYARAGTPGYAAPEQMAGAPPRPEGDLYSLGATLCFVFTGSTPVFLPEAPPVRSGQERLAEWLTVHGLSPALRELISGLMADRPEDRWTTARALRALAGASGPSGEVVSSNHARMSDDAWHSAVDGITSYLVTSMDTADTERLWTPSCGQVVIDPCTLQLGAAGVLGVLTRCFELTGDERLGPAIADASRWIARRLDADATRGPGLHFGAAGVAWALYEAGRAIGDDDLTGHGPKMARTLPTSSPNPDITHGTAGIGLARLHLGLRAHDDDLLKRAAESADVLVDSADDGPDGLIWGTPAAFESRLAGGRYYGYAHGTAGVGYFLLAAGRALERYDFVTLAVRAGETLIEQATLTDTAALWGAGPGDPTTAPYWCHGSAGIGTFLIRLYGATGDDRFRKVAEMCAQAVIENAGRGVLGQCHGLAGNGEFLLDMAQAADRPQYQAMAEQVARIILASRARRNGMDLFPDEQGGISASWADGVGGVLAFLLRLRYSSARLWMTEPTPDQSVQP
ncbi:MAG: class IV lanthionine synthetase LanL [Streptosporangiales bacterium]